MKKKIIYGLLFAVAMVTASSSFVSCKDYEGDDYRELKEKNASLADLLEKQRIALQNCSTNCANEHALLWAEFANYATKTDLNNYVSKAKFTTDSTALAEAIKTNATAIETLEKALKNYVTLEKFTTDSTEFMRLINDNQVAATAAKALADQAMKLAQDDSIRIDGLKENYDDLNRNFDSFINAWGADLTAALAEVARVRAIADAVVLDSAKWNQAAIDAKSAVDTLNKYMNTWNQAAIDAKSALDSLNKYQDAWNLAVINAQEAKDTLDKYQDAWNNAVINAKGAKDTLDKYQDAWNNAVVLAKKATDFIGTTEYKTLQELIDAYKDADQALAGEIQDLNDEVAKLKNTLAKMITGVTIQATYSPVLGNGSLPFSLQTNLLAAYVGKSSNDNVFFPSVYDEDYADGTKVLTESDKAYLETLGFWPSEFALPAKGEYIISDREDNAGKVYLTVNPTNTDFTGTTFDMVNSAGEISRMQLSDLTPCKDILTFGWTRSGAAASPNGFYEASAKVLKDDIKKLQANINAGKFEKAFKEQLNSVNNGTAKVSYVAAMDLARAVYSSLEPLQRNGIRAQWMDDAAGVTRSYTSAFDIAATVAAPIGFGFSIPDGKYTRLPIFNTDYLKNRFHLKGEVKLLTVKSKASGENYIFCEVPVAALDATYLIQNAVDGSTYAGYVIYYPHDYNVSLAPLGIDIDIHTGYALIDFTDLFKEIYGQVNAGFATVNSLVSQANKRIDYVVNYIDDYNAYATKINKWIANANNMLQPVLLWCDSENVGQLGGMITGNYAVGTVVPAGGAVALVPTTYTLELLAPAFKKSVIVTNVYKDGLSAQGGEAALEKALKDINGKLKGKFDLYEGHSLKDAFIFEAKSEYEGMTFEIAYTAVDYTGQVAGRKFYLTVGPAK